MRPRVTIDCFPSSLANYVDGWAVVAVDVIRATTTAVTAVSTGRRCIAVQDLASAHAAAISLRHPVLAGERGGVRPPGFDENNSPAAIARRTDVHRPLVLLSTAGTQLLHEVGPRRAVYAACLRNVTATVQHAAARHERVAVVGAGTHGEFRPEDQLGCAWVAAGLLDAGFTASAPTRALIEQWRNAPVERITASRSADYLRRTHQLADLQFVLDHVDDVPLAVTVYDQLDLSGELIGSEVGLLTGSAPQASPCGAA